MTVGPRKYQKKKNQRKFAYALHTFRLNTDTQWQLYIHTYTTLWLYRSRCLKWLAVVSEKKKFSIRDIRPFFSLLANKFDLFDTNILLRAVPVKHLQFCLQYYYDIHLTLVYNSR